ncbi:unnamed protein product [Lathyrus sativus]|nr:unnamed protein product [Lathyrus sativus]
MEGFDEFIVEADLVDLPLIGRRFTWSNLEGSFMSRIDRFLVSDGWLEHCPNCYQRCLDKKLSDHCPIMINAWRKLEVQGWGGYVLREKHKLIKLKLKEWSKEHTEHLDDRIEGEKRKVNELDCKGEKSMLSTDEVNLKRELTAQLLSMVKLKTSMQWQKLRMKCLSEGDTNTEFFHRCITNRRKKNEILCIKKDGSKMYEVHEIKKEMIEFFTEVYGGNKDKRAMLLDFKFKRIDIEANEFFTASFFEKEVRDAVWECDGMKSLGPNGINLGFSKSFGNS